ncbi:MAG: hypothetical protein Q8L37_05165 [Candidatus Gottesmanbacteria bacterium]|nr:hypothetical protein [Candidatus Gottesmanbacteria bacterium]
MTTTTQFQTIATSQLLNRFEKPVMADVPEGLPDDIRDTLVTILQSFDQRSLTRREALIVKVSAAFETYKQEIADVPNIDDKRRNDLLSQAADLEKTLLTKLQSSRHH